MYQQKPMDKPLDKRDNNPDLIDHLDYRVKVVIRYAVLLVILILFIGIEEGITTA
ncbi:MAG: hypothetical protein ACXADH_11240 [Candidatus Kariarchaeaceae archaeon]|jgi:hypothetical protein